MLFHHGGVVVNPILTKDGTVFVAGAKMLYEDGSEKSLGVLGHFACEQAAMRFAIASAMAFLDGNPMPRTD